MFENVPAGSGDVETSSLLCRTQNQICSPETVSRSCKSGHHSKSVAVGRNELTSRTLLSLTK